MHAATCYALIERRRRRALFLTTTARQVKSGELLREAGRAAAALGGLAAWTGVLLLLAA